MISSSGTAGPTVAGVDGCRAGWVVVTAAPGDGGAVEVRSVEVVPRLDGLLAAVVAGEVATVALDMPVGLADNGPRAADRAARAALGPRRSSVFPAPVRAVLDAVDHADAVRRSRAACGAGIPVQAWHLVPKVREVDDLLRGPAAPVRHAVRETHPELAFATLAGAPCRSPKRTTAGRRERLALLHRHVPRRWTVPAGVPRGARPDDVLDALVLAVRAVQWDHGGPPPVRLGGGTDRHGLAMEVWG